MTSATKAPLRFPLLDEPLRPHPGARVGRLALQRDRRNASLTVPLSLLRNGSAQRVSASLSLGSAQSLGLSASLALILREFEEDESGVAHLDRQDDAVEHAVAVEPAALRASSRAEGGERVGGGGLDRARQLIVAPVRSRTPAVGSGHSLVPLREAGRPAARETADGLASEAAPSRPGGTGR